jgi:hypothetical protein
MKLRVHFSPSPSGRGPGRGDKKAVRDINAQAISYTFLNSALIE